MTAAHAPKDIQSELLTRLSSARQATDQVLELVHPDSLYERPIGERHRIVFYIGHLEAFDWNLLHSQLPGLVPFDKDLDRLFAFGIDPVDGGLPADTAADWPKLGAVAAYARRVRRELDEALAKTRTKEWCGPHSAFTLLNTAIEHRLMHAETLAYMLHQLPIERKKRCEQAVVASIGVVQHETIHVPEGFTKLGLARESEQETFGWDNEYDSHDVLVPGFVIDRFKVTNRDYLEFVNAGGYTQRNLWNAPDWEWINREGIQHPVFWKSAHGKWWYRGMFDEILLPLDWPVYVSHSEANAYARWKGKRLPTEAEWQRAAFGDGEWRLHAALPLVQRWDPTPENSSHHVLSPYGVAAMIGNGWEWTSTVFAPFPGFSAFPFYQGYSANFFDGKHYVMKGGSTRTDACMLRPSFRNWFQPHYQYVYAGFRCVTD